MYTYLLSLQREVVIAAKNSNVMQYLSHRRYKKANYPHSVLRPIMLIWRTATEHNSRCMHNIKN